jgi:DNA-directed RNA polymerase sigma subunit (sigma70/sigma32)
VVLPESHLAIPYAGSPGRRREAMTQQQNDPSIQAFVALERATQRLQRMHGRQPTIDEIAEEMGLSGPEVRQLVEAAHGTITFCPI